MVSKTTQSCGKAWPVSWVPCSIHLTQKGGSISFCARNLDFLFFNFFMKALKPNYCVQGYIIMRDLSLISLVLVNMEWSPGALRLESDWKRGLMSTQFVVSWPTVKNSKYSWYLNCWARWLDETLYPKTYSQGLRIHFAETPELSEVALLPLCHGECLPDITLHTHTYQQYPVPIQEIQTVVRILLSISNWIRQICGQIPDNASQSGLCIIRLSLTASPHHSKG